MIRRWEARTAMTDAEAALRKALLEMLIDHPLRIHVDAEAMSDTAWEYLQASNHAHPVVAKVLREAACELTT